MQNETIEEVLELKVPHLSVVGALPYLAHCTTLYISIVLKMMIIGLHIATELVFEDVFPLL